LRTSYQQVAPGTHTTGTKNHDASTVNQSKIKEQSIYHPKYVLCDILFVTYINIATYFDTEVPSSGSHHSKCIQSTQQYMFHSSLYAVDMS